LDARSRAADLLALVPAAAIPLLFLHRRYQLHGAVGPVDVYTSDLAILAVVAAALAAGLRFGWRPLLGPRRLWIATGCLLGLFVVSCLWAPVEQPTRHLVTAAKVIEYALLAPAVVLLLRRKEQIDRFLLAFVGWACAASGWGLLQFFGLVNEFEGKRPGQREVSFIGHQDLGGFTGAALAVAFAAIVLGERRRLAQVAAVAGVLGVVLDASVFVYLGCLLAAGAAVWIGRRAGTLTLRRGLALAGILAVTGAGVLVLRASDFSNFMSFLGIRSTNASIAQDVQTGSQRTMLAWIGLRIWIDHPILGVGFDRSQNRYQDYLAEAKRKFPDQPAQAYPSPEHPWGIQNLWVQLLADTGVVGLLLALLTFILGLRRALTAPRAAVFLGLVAAGWILVAAGTWNALGIVAGIPLEAVTWFGLGLAAVAGSVEP